MSANVSIWLSAEDRAELESWVADRNTPQKLVWRHKSESRPTPGQAHSRRSSQSANPLNFSPEAGIDESRKFDGVARKLPVEK